MTLGWPSKTERDNFLVSTLDVIGRTVDFYYVDSLSGCSVCSLDPVSNTSTDAFCPVCSGFYWLETIGHVVQSGHVTWKYSEDISRYSPGTQFDGDCQVRINYSPAIHEMVQKTKYMVVDDRVMQVNRITLRGAPEVNRILVALMEKEKET